MHKKGLKTRISTNGDLLNNENILIYDGTNEKLSNPFMGYVRENRLEILNIKTGKSTLLKNRYSSSLYYPMLLNDGRIFSLLKMGMNYLFLKNNK